LFLPPMHFGTIGSPAKWGGFLAFVLAMLALDLGLFHREAHTVSAKEAAGWSAAWVALAAVFGLGVHHWFGPERALEFATGYLIEKALAVDNLFVFIVIFAVFRVPQRSSCWPGARCCSASTRPCTSSAGSSPSPG